MFRKKGKQQPPFHPLGSFDSALKELSGKVRELLKRKLWLKVLIGMGLGILLGILLGPDVGLVKPETSRTVTDWLALPGNLFLQIVKMIVIPLVFSSIIIGIVSSGDPAFLKRIGPRLLLYFVFTTLVATSLGFGVGNLIRPGDYIDIASLPSEQQASLGLDEKVEVETETDIKDINIPEQLVKVLPDNPLASMVNGDMLGVVIFTMIIGLAMMALDKHHYEPFVNMLETLQELSMTVVRWAMELVPFAVFGLMSRITSQIGLQALAGLGAYIGTVLLGLLLLMVFYLLIVTLFARMNPFHFLKNIRDVQLLAFSTSSSAAVMPLSIKAAEEKLKVRPAIAQFLIPVGATINMDGTALYQVVATVFLSQVFGIELSMFNMLLIVAITVGASIGAPSAPGVGIVILATILAQVGIPAGGVALIIGVDRILDMSRTTANVTGDLTACTFFNKRMAHLFANGNNNQQGDLSSAAEPAAT